MKLKVFWLCLVLSFGFRGLAQNYTISGYVREDGSEESLIGANIVDAEKKLGSSTNAYGFYSITLPKDSVYLAVSYIGYKTEYYKLYLDRNVQLNFFLKPSADLLGEVEVVAEDYIQEEVQMSTIDVPMKQIDKLPALMGERDVMKVIQLLPGVQSGNEGTSGIYVRGGGPDQNLILLDGVPVYNASHLFGFFSVFNSDATKSVKLTKGGFPARFGGRLSSVVEINMKDGSREKWGGSGTVGLIASRFMVEGPVVKGKSSLMLAARRTYIDLLIQPFLVAANGEMAGYYFQDLNLKYNHDIGENSRIYASLYTGKDEFYYQYTFRDGTYLSRERAGFDWGNITSALRYNYQVGSKGFLNITGTYSRYRYHLGYEDLERYQGQEDIIGYRYFSQIQDLGLKADMDYRLSQKHFLRFGLNGTRHHFQPGAIQFQDGNLDSTILNSESIYTQDYFAYIEDEIKVNQRLSLNPGLHFTLYRVGETNYKSVQPRFSSRYLITEDLSVKASYAFMQQYLHLLTNSNVGLPTDLWVSSTEKIPPMNSHQVAAGVARMLYEKRFEFSLETFYKRMTGLITYKNGAGFLNGGDWQERVETGGLGESYGAELFLQKKTGRLTGWIGYTLSWSNRHFPGTRVNNGNPYPYKFDRRHDLSFVCNYEHTEKLDFGLSWVYGTGNAITMPEGYFYSENLQSPSFPYGTAYNIDYGEKNGFRMEAYHRLDLSVNYTKPKKKGEAIWSFSVYNAYSRANPFFYNWETEYSPDGQGRTYLAKLALFPLIPGVSWTRNF